MKTCDISGATLDEPNTDYRLIAERIVSSWNHGKICTIEEAQERLVSSFAEILEETMKRERKFGVLWAADRVGTDGWNPGDLRREADRVNEKELADE